MNPVAGPIITLATEIADLTAELGRRVSIDERAVLRRGPEIDLQPPGLWSPNRSCRLVRAADGWIAVNLPREEDRGSVPAWIGCELEAEPWAAIQAAARTSSWRRLIDDACRLAMPVAAVGEIRRQTLEAPLIRMAPAEGARAGRLRVVDLSSLWAGPLCGAVLADMGAAVLKVESRSRPDSARLSAPNFFDRLNHRKAHLSLDFDMPVDIDRLRSELLQADIVISGARPRAFSQLGLAPETLYLANPRLVWVAITGYGWFGHGSNRVAFGDDAAAAGGLLRWTARGEPRFLGDALADPLTGLAGAVGALKALRDGGGLMVDAALARTAAGAAAHSHMASVA